ncbi:MAG: MBOAT family protein [Bacteroidales bacterium]|nr:MBOAT family protein [Bacteroidales bacterium]
MNPENLKIFFTNIFSFDAKYPLLFTQFYFWAFFAIIFAIFALVKNKRLLRNSFLCFASLFFYYKTSGLFVLILLFSIIYGFFIGKRIAKSEAEGAKKFWLVTGVIINLGVLCYFKYAYFFTDVYNSLVHSQYEVVNYLALWTNELTGKNYFDAGKILLPVGISFYTFQNISYLVDVKRDKVKPVANILDFGFYTTFFPQLVAGPIVRANQFVPQLYNKYFLSRRQFGIALFWILNGLLKKIILSDYLAVNFVDRVFNNPGLFTPFENLSALFLYSLQVYADFSGYTDIAIGVAMLMGFYLPLNFNSPYKATNPGNFWKRWHVSLSTWLKDYLYIPLGGNRNGTFGSYFLIIAIAVIAIFLSGSLWVAGAVAAVAVILGVVAVLVPRSRKPITTNINMMDTMLLGGLWHGASWNFMIWGGLNGIGILAYKMWRNVSKIWRSIISLVVFDMFIALNHFFPHPAFVIGIVWSGIFFFGTLVDTLYSAIFKNRPIEWLSRGWAILMTFIFITFTRLFFRSGSNLDAAEANATAWNTAKEMVGRIGSSWNVSVIPQIIGNYWFVFCLFIFGMIIHWLPDKLKRRYRLSFAMAPVWLQLIMTLVAVFIAYQFITADLQPFIYFQF